MCSLHKRKTCYNMVSRCCLRLVLNGRKHSTFAVIAVAYHPPEFRRKYLSIFKIEKLGQKREYLRGIALIDPAL